MNQQDNYRFENHQRYTDSKQQYDNNCNNNSNTQNNNGFKREYTTTAENYFAAC